MSRVANIRLGCQYPEAWYAATRWRNVPTGRCSFREIPADRVGPVDNHSSDWTAPDYAVQRLARNVSGSTYRDCAGRGSQQS